MVDRNCPTVGQIPPLCSSVRKSSREDPKTVGERCNRRNERQDISQSVVRSAKEKLRRNQISIGYKRIKQTYTNIQISNGNNQDCKTRIVSRCIHRVHRSKRRLLAHTYPQKDATIPRISHRKKVLPLQSPALRAKPSAQGLHKDHESSTTQARPGRGEHNNVLRRLDDHSSFVSRVQGDDREDSSNRQRNGPLIQHGEINTRTLQDDGLARPLLEHSTSNCSTIKRQSGEVLIEKPSNNELHPTDPSSVGVPDRITQSRGGCGASRKTLCEKTHSSRQEGVLNQPQRSSRASSSTNQECPEVVGRRGTPSICNAVGPQAPVPHPHDGRVRLGLGVPVVGRPPGFGSVEPILEEQAHQPSRTANGLDCDTIGTVQASFHPGSFRQHDDGPLPEQSRIESVGVIEQAINDNPRDSCTSRSPPFCSSPCGGGEPMGGFPIEAICIIHPLGAQDDSFPEPDQSLWTAADRPVRNGSEHETASLPVEDGPDASRRTERILGGLESVASPLPLPPTGDFDHDESDQSFEGFQRPGPDDRSALALAALGSRAAQPLSGTASAQRAVPGGQPQSEIDRVLQLSRMEFLREQLNHEVPPQTVEDILNGLRPSTLRQYQSGWRKFQSFIRVTNKMRLDKNIFFEFASYLFHDLKLSTSSISCHLSTIYDPLQFGFQLFPDPRILELLKNSYFLQRPRKRKPDPQWSLQKVLTFLSSARYTTNPSSADLFHKSVFLTALATGFRISQLAAIVRTSAFLRFGLEDASVSLAPHPMFLAKNERIGHTIGPKVIPAWKVEGEHHTLCPVGAIRQYISKTQTNSDRLWVWPDTGFQCSAHHLAKVICRVIEAADPGKSPTAHQVRGVSASVAYMRSFQVPLVQASGQWASCNSFINRYLALDVQDVPCVAMGLSPS